MKYLWISGLLLFYPLQAELSVQKINEMVKKIQGKRQSKVTVDFGKVVSPFGIVVTKTDENSTAAPVIKVMEQQASFDLSAIINDRARINGRWLKVGDTIQGYRVESIGENRVLLKKADWSVELFLPNPENTKLFQIK
ncbi:hypothetical protein [Nitratifractor sp.]|uniref:hypothetical protein n=1 Tax=Nitratifractor sp. TaxID=2268144 RepID=UPI0025E61440|nr:hypothetical protein [Nitratifractor sp.]